MSLLHNSQVSPSNELLLQEVSTVRRSPFDVHKPLLSHISCRFRSSELTVLFGPSGCGKSSLLRLLNRLDDAETGYISLNGAAITTLPPQLLRQRVGMMLQQAYMFQGTVLENLLVPFRYRGMTPPAADSRDIVDILDLVRLPLSYRDRDARSLSGGEQQRVSLARCLVSMPEALLLDEPTSALDPPTADGLGLTLHEICKTRGLIVVMVTHDVRLAERIADQGVFLIDGTIGEAGALPKLFQEPQTAALYDFLHNPPPGKPRSLGGDGRRLPLNIFA